MNRRSFIRRGALLVPAVVGIKAYPQAFTLADPAVVPVAAAGTSCQIWKSQTTNNDYWAGSIGVFESQKIKNDSASEVTLCRVDFWFKNLSSAANVYVKARTAQYSSGADIGSASDTVAVAANHNDWLTFTWSSGAPTIAAGTDFWVGWYSDQSHECRVGYDTAAPVGQYYEDDGYAFYKGSFLQSDSDLVFRIYTMQ